LNIVNFFWAIPVFGLLIFIHELGHFSVAKLYGIRVHEFALGFGPVLAGLQRGETRYNLRIIPLGGFVRMAGMEEGDGDDPQGFNRKPVFARALVIFAGPLMNFVLAAALFAGSMYFVGTVRDNAVLGDLLQSCPVMVGGASVSQPCPAQAGGLLAGDVIQRINNTPVSNWMDIQDAVKKSAGTPITFVVLRGVEVKSIRVEPLFSEERWMVGIQPSNNRTPLPLGQSIVQGVGMTGTMFVAMLKGIVAMVSGTMKPELAGPIGITKTIASTASQGLDSLITLTAFLSINLGLFNLLPIPALDGSRLVFMIVEGIRGRRVDPHRENMVHFVGFLLLIGLMVVITYGEVIRR
jgi:regulator of sigma E protease